MDVTMESIAQKIENLQASLSVMKADDGETLPSDENNRKGINKPPVLYLLTYPDQKNQSAVTPSCQIAAIEDEDAMSALAESQDALDDFNLKSLDDATTTTWCERFKSIQVERPAKRTEDFRPSCPFSHKTRPPEDGHVPGALGGDRIMPLRSLDLEWLCLYSFLSLIAAMNICATSTVIPRSAQR